MFYPFWGLGELGTCVSGGRMERYVRCHLSTMRPIALLSCSSSPPFVPRTKFLSGRERVDPGGQPDNYPLVRVFEAKHASNGSFEDQAATCWRKPQENHGFSRENRSRQALSSQRAGRVGLLPLLPVLVGHCQAVNLGVGRGPRLL